jgi:hypothetical protein
VYLNPPSPHGLIINEAQGKLFLHVFNKRHRCSSVGIGTGWTTGVRVNDRCHSVQTGFRHHPAPCPMGTGGNAAFFGIFN